jgi:hypothetical protein
LRQRAYKPEESEKPAIGAICHKNAANLFKQSNGPWAGRGVTAQLSSRSDLLHVFAYALLALM